MHHLPNHVHRNLGRRIELENAEGLLRPIVVIRPQIGDEATRMAQPLGFGETLVSQPELRLGALSLFFRSLSVFDVRVDPVPLDDVSLLVTQWVRAKEKPPIL